MDHTIRPVPTGLTTKAWDECTSTIHSIRNHRRRDISQSKSGEMNPRFEGSISSVRLGCLHSRDVRPMKTKREESGVSELDHQNTWQCTKCAKDQERTLCIQIGSKQPSVLHLACAMSGLMIESL